MQMTFVLCTGRILLWDTNFTFFHLQLKNDKQDFDEIFRNEALKHYETGHKNSPPEVVAMETVTHSLFFFQDHKVL